MLSRRNFIKLSVLSGTGALIGCKSSGSSNISANARFDTIVKNGLVYDGTGAKPLKADVGIKEGKITAIGDLGDSAHQLIDAEGMAVSPGFVDMHGHSDTKFFICPEADSRIYQGITTEVGGNCGYGPFPRNKQYAEQFKDMPLSERKEWGELDEFFTALDKHKLSINFATYTGHGDIRAAIIGAHDIQPTADQLKQMKALLQYTIEQGSFGMTTGLEYAPGCYALEHELTELCKVVAKNNGLYATHMRNEGDYVEESLAEAINTARNSGVRIEISHLKAQNEPNWHKLPKILKTIEDTRKSGIDIMFDRYPYTAYSTELPMFIPQWALQGSRDEKVAKIGDKSSAAKIDEYALAKIKEQGGGKNILITSCKTEGNRMYIGKNLEECAEISGKSMPAFIRNLLVEERMDVDIIGFTMSEENLRMILSHPLSMPVTDGSIYAQQGPLSLIMPHPRCYNTFPRFIGKYGRDEGLLSMAEAIKKATSVPANRIGLKHRGQIQIGYHADIVVFNPNTIIDQSDYTNPHQLPLGINHVFVNGEWTIKDGKHTGAMGGMTLRKG